MLCPRGRETKERRTRSERREDLTVPVVSWCEDALMPKFKLPQIVWDFKVVEISTVGKNGNTFPTTKYSFIIGKPIGSSVPLGEVSLEKDLNLNEVK